VVSPLCRCPRRLRSRRDTSRPLSQRERSVALLAFLGNLAIAPEREAQAETMRLSKPLCVLWNRGDAGCQRQGRKLLPDFDAFGCLRSLRARSALDGVSRVQGWVEIAVGQRLDHATISAPSSAPSLGRVISSLLRIKITRFQSLVELGRSECLVGVPNVKFRDAFPRRLRPSRNSLGG
jgi:hypothetical protein